MDIKTNEYRKKENKNRIKGLILAILVAPTLCGWTAGPPQLNPQDSMKKLVAKVEEMDADRSALNALMNKEMDLFGTTKVNITGTYYNPVPSQCWGDPLVTADGSKINLNKLEKGKLKWIAVSRDLRKHFKYGDVVHISSESDPSIDGLYEVHDTMHPRWRNRIDFLRPTKYKGEGRWGDLIIRLWKGPY